MPGNKSLFVTLIILTIILIFIIIFVVGKQKMIFIEQKTNQTNETVILCPSSGKVQGQLKYEDTLQTITTYKDSITAYFVSENNFDVLSNSFSTTSWSSSVDLLCKEKYTPVALTTIDKTISSVGSIDIAQGALFQQVLLGKSINPLTIKVKNLVDDVYMNITNSQDSSNTDYQVLDNDLTNISDSSGYSSFDINNDGYINIDISLKTNNTLTVFGEDSLNVYICVDSNKNVWDEPLISLNSFALTDVFKNMNLNDRKALNGFEYCYKIPQITDITQTINYYQETVSGQNPSSSDSPVIYFIAEGRYLSNKEVDTKGDKLVKIGAFQDDTSFTQVEVSNKQKIRLAIS